AVVTDVAALVRTQKSFRDVRLDTEVQGDLHAVLPGPRLTQVLLNLVLNAGAAAAAGTRGDGATAGERRGGRVVVRARRDGAAVRIEVEDDGPGVDPGVRERLFEPFVTTKEVGEGTGLGLAVCRGLVESVGGEIGLDASYTQGARFVVTLGAA
ncbi:MAG: sensor histidine kinase, partial [Polyangiaceae bacterium]